MNNKNEMLELMESVGFKPNANQLKAIEYVDGPLYLPAGPGSGKTRVLLWRTFNLIVYHGIDPSEIFLSTFTEKAALQLKNGLQSLLALAFQRYGKPYDLAEMYVGTIHSACRKILSDRRFVEGRRRPRTPAVMDEIQQFIFLYRGAGWNSIRAFFLREASITDNKAIAERINSAFGDVSNSRTRAVENLVSFFNRVSEEAPVLDDWEKKAVAMGMEQYHEGIRLLFSLYREYLAVLDSGLIPQTDLSRLQSLAVDRVLETPHGGSVFKHVIIDEYQDTNSIQERLVFGLAAGTKNLCVVGDDDQALYRFRGATVENFVFFPERSQTILGVHPLEVPITINYRSRSGIVDAYSSFVSLADWNSEDGTESYRVNKKIKAHRKDEEPSVFRTSRSDADDAAKEVAELVKGLLDEGKVDDPNQIAFLFPSLKSTIVGKFKEALESQGLLVYAPRAGSFFETDEAKEMTGLIASVFGIAELSDHDPGFVSWFARARECSDVLLKEDKLLKSFVKAKSDELDRSRADFKTLNNAAHRAGLDTAAPYDWKTMKRPLSEASGLSDTAKRTFLSTAFERSARARLDAGNPYSLAYAISRAVSLDWTLLDLFYRFCAFPHFQKMFDDAQESGDDGTPMDEGPICNLSLLSGYIDRFLSEYFTIVSPETLEGDFVRKLFFSQYLYILWRKGESEYENPEDPFPRGRIPFLTIHQSKGLEFPVVVVGNLTKRESERPIDALLGDYYESVREPREKRGLYDSMRKYYVAFSRAENLLVLTGAKRYVATDFQAFVAGFPEIKDIDLAQIPQAQASSDELPKNYSYTGDFLFYSRCPRQYMVFRKYGFAPSRMQAIAFGNLVHETIEDLHEFLVARREVAGDK